MPNYLGEFIKELRGDMSLREFGKMCDVSHTHIDSIEKGADPRTGKTVNVTVDMLKKIAKATKTDLAFLVALSTGISPEEFDLKKNETTLTKFIRKAQGNRTQNEFAMHTGVSSAAISRICSGQYAPKPLQLQKIAARAHNDVTYEQLMEAAGYLTPTTNSQRTTKGVSIPVYGRIAAGIPIEAVEDVLDYEEITPEMAATGDYIALQIKGDSMASRISDGDVVIIRIQPDVDSGDIAAVFVNGDSVTLKKIKKESNGIWLIAFNPAYQPVFYSSDDCARLPIRFLGKMVELRAKF